MTFRTLIRRSLRFHWRAHLGVVLGAAIGSAALIGALVVGDSVKGSLQAQALERLPADCWLAMSAGDRFFPMNLTERLYLASSNHSPDQYPGVKPAVTNQTSQIAAQTRDLNLTWGVPGFPLGYALIQLPGSAARADGTSRANKITVYGIDTEFARNYLGTNTPSQLQPGNVLLNAALAAQLQVQAGDRLIIRIPKPTAFSQDNAVSRRDDASVVIRLVVAGILPTGCGNLSLASGGALNAFLRHDDLAQTISLEQQANLLLANAGFRWLPDSTLLDRFHTSRLIHQGGFGANPLLTFDWVRPDNWQLGHHQTTSEMVMLASKLLATAWSLADVQTRLRLLDTQAQANTLELNTTRIFLDPAIIKSALAASTNSQPELTYLVNLLRSGTNATPYSMVTAAGMPWTPADLRDGEIVVGQWLADDLHVKPGDEIALSYFLPESGARLEEATNKFRVHSIAPMEMPWADRTLMPDFPGIEKAESTSEWDAGFPLTYEIRKKDDDYWRQYRGTPKAFITLAAGQKLWGNRFGNLTAIRFSIPTNAIRDGAPSRKLPMPSGSQTNQSEPPHVGAYKAELERKILANLKPEELGLRFEPVREQALKAASESQDFGGLFLGFSFFLILAALLLMAMLFQFGLEQRAPEIGTLLALGFTPKQVRQLLLREGLTLAFLGGIAGAVGGIYFAKAMLHGLATVWRDAVGAAVLSFHVTAQTLVVGLLASMVVSTVVIGLGLRKFVQRPARELLVGEIGGGDSRVQGPRSKVVAVGALVAGLALVGWAVMKGDTQNAGIFFGAGALVLIAGLSFVSGWLAGLSGAPSAGAARTNHRHHQVEAALGAPLTMATLAVRGCARRRKRSLVTVAMLACGSFLIVSIGVFRLDANRDATQKTSGTGGFALLGETTLPVVQDLNSASGREFFALDERDLEGVNIVSFRVRAGDEASCLNLNRAQKPRLLGVKSELLEGRFTFTKLVDRGFDDKPWETLNGFYPKYDQPLATDEIAAIGDANSIQWAMGKKIGDTMDYVDERGQPFKVRIVGAVANSILQGQLIIDEAAFVKRFPGESGYRMFLLDAPSNAVSQVSATLSRALQDVGLELTPTAARLNQFNAVQNTYLGTFQVLGGLGLLLGSVGLGIVVLRNVLERRSELAVLLAVGFRKTQVQRLLLLENGVLLLAGLVIGISAAVIAVLPALLAPTGQFPVVSLALTLGAVLLNGAVWTWAATRYAVRGDLLAALRNE